MNSTSSYSTMKDLKIPDKYQLECVNFDRFSETDWHELLTLDEFIEAESDPGFPYSPDLAKKRLTVPRPNSYVEIWLARSLEEHSAIIGYVLFNILTPDSPNYQNNGQTVRTWLVVHPDHRRKGVGKAFLRLLCQLGLEHNKKDISLDTSTSDGQKFLERLSKQSDLEAAENRLFFSDIDWKKIEQLHSEAKKKSQTTSIETYDSIPDDFIEEYAKVETSVLNDVPFGTLDLKFTVTPESIRQREAFERSLGYKFLVKIAREQDGSISGMTDIKINTYTPSVILQGLTGVLQKYRGKNIGLFLKTDMLLTLKDTNPETNFISTGNADQNAPMLRINHALGYKKANAWKSYKFNITNLLDKLQI